MLFCVARDSRTKASYENVSRFVPVSIHPSDLPTCMFTQLQLHTVSRVLINTSIFSSLQEGCDLQEIATKVQQPHPLLIIPGTVQNPQGCHLFAEGTVILKGEVDNAVGLLLASFFVFSMHYPAGLSNFYTVLEVLLLDQKPKKCPITVAHVLTQLQYEL